MKNKMKGKTNNAKSGFPKRGRLLFSCCRGLVGYCLLGLLGILSIQGVFAQQDDLNLKKLRLMEEIKQFEEDIQTERKNLESYLKEKTALSDRKRKEINAVKREIQTRRKELGSLKNETSLLERAIERSAQDEAAFSLFLQDYAKGILEEIDADTDIPFDKERRLGSIQTIITDLQAGEASASEAFTRLLTFLDTELAMGYDSEVIRSVLKIQGKEESVDLLRIGRLLFAVDNGKNIYLYKKDDDGNYFLDDATEISFEDRQSLENAILMINGRQPSDLLEIPLQGSHLIKNF